MFGANLSLAYHLGRLSPNWASGTSVHPPNRGTYFSGEASGRPNSATLLTPHNGAGALKLGGDEVDVVISMDGGMLLAYTSIVSTLVVAGWGVGRLAAWALNRRTNSVGEATLRRFGAASVQSEGWS